MTFSAAQITALRQPEQRSDWFLGFYPPPTVLACQVDDVDAAKGDRIITFDGVSEGAWGDVLQDMMMYIGTAAGKADLGRIRVESATATTLIVAENDDIVWADDIYLTVVRFWEPVAIYPRHTYDEESDVVTWYKRYNLAYTDQNVNRPPVPCMEGHFAGFVDHPSGVYFNGSESYDFEGESLSFDWAFPSGTPDTSSAEIPGYISYGQAGYYTASMEVEEAGGNKTYSGYRHIMLFDRPGEGPNRPLMATEFNVAVQGSRNAGGFEATFRIRTDVEDVDLSAIRDGALCIIFADEWFDGTKRSYGQHQGREHLVFVGYITDDSLSLSPNGNYLEFTALSAMRIMENRDLHPIALDYKDTPVDWSQMSHLTVDKAVHHYLVWHTTMYRICDINNTGDTKKLMMADFGREGVAKALRKFLWGAIFADAVSDAQGYVNQGRHPSMLPDGSRPAGTLMRLLPTDWQEPLQIIRRAENVASYVELGGVYCAGPTEEENWAFLAGAPGDSPAYSGLPRTRTGYALNGTGQAHLNQLAGRYFAYLNNSYSDLPIRLSGNYRCLPLVPAQRVFFDVGSALDPRGAEWNQKTYLIKEVVHTLLEGRCFTELALEAETDGPEGETIIIPDTPTWEPVPWDWPDPPVPREPPEAPGGFVSDGSWVVIQVNDIIGVTSNFLDGSPRYRAVPKPPGTFMYRGILNPYRLMEGVAELWIAGNTGVWKCPDVYSESPQWYQKLTSAAFFAETGEYISSVREIEAARSQPNTYYIQIRTNSADLWVGYTNDNGETWSFGRVGDPTTTSGPLGFAVSPHNANKVFCCAGDGELMGSDDFATSFELKYTVPWPSGPIRNIFLPYNNNPNDQRIFISGENENQDGTLLLLGTYGDSDYNLAFSTEDGATGTWQMHPWPDPNVYALSFVEDAGGGAAVATPRFSAVQNKYPWRSQTPWIATGTWYNTGWDPLDWANAYTPMCRNSKGHIFLMDIRRVHRSVNQGRTFNLFSEITGSFAGQDILCTDDDTLIAVGHAGDADDAFIRVSHDDAKTWIKAIKGNQPPDWANEGLSLCQLANGDILCGTADGTTYRSPSPYYGASGSWVYNGIVLEAHTGSYYQMSIDSLFQTAAGTVLAGHDITEEEWGWNVMHRNINDGHSGSWEPIMQWSDDVIDWENHWYVSRVRDIIQAANGDIFAVGDMDFNLVPGLDPATIMRSKAADDGASGTWESIVLKDDWYGQCYDAKVIRSQPPKEYTLKSINGATGTFTDVTPAGGGFVGWRNMMSPVLEGTKFFGVGGNKLYYSGNNGVSGSWSQRADFSTRPPADEDGQSALEIFPYDGDKLFLLQHRESGGSPTAMILYSPDGGTTLLDKSGDWALVVQATWGLDGGVGGSIIPIWVQP